MLSGDESLRVRDATRERVRLAAAELEYQPNFLARGLARAKAGAVGLLVPAGNPLMLEVMAGAEDTAIDRGLLLWTTAHDGELSDRYLRLLQSGALDAALIAGLRAGYSADRLIRDPRVPTLLVDRRTVGSDRWIILDDERAARLATEYLIVRGHRRIGWAGGRAGVDTAERRQNGVRDAMAAADLWLDPSWVVGTDYTPQGGAAAVAAIMRSHVRPTAIVVADPNEALGAWHELERLGLRVPEDVSLIAIHRLPAEGYRVRPLTSVEMPLRELGRRAVATVLDTPWNQPVREVLADGYHVAEGATVALAPPP